LGELVPVGKLRNMATTFLKRVEADSERKSLKISLDSRDVNAG